MLWLAVKRLTKERDNDESGHDAWSTGCCEGMQVIAPWYFGANEDAPTVRATRRRSCGAREKPVHLLKTLKNA
jgi:hypothetical protein